MHEKYLHKEGFRFRFKKGNITITASLANSPTGTIGFYVIF